MPPSPARPMSFDARPLTAPVDSGAVKAFTAAMRARRTTSAKTVLVIVVLSFIGVVFFALVIPFLSLLFADFNGPSFLLVPLLIMVALAIGVGFLIWRGIRAGKIARYRISQFAAANNMTYEDHVDDPPLPGMIFSLGSGRQADRLVRGHVPRFVEFGNYQYTTGSGKNSTTHHWGYVAVKLDVPLPNIVLDALGNNSFGTNLPASFRKDQELSLEGDFNRYFTLYCPEGYEQDALYLFTPDIMARFIDNAAQLDVEIVDDWMFLYTKREASTLDAATWAWLFNVVGALITKFDQWARWRDDRLIQEQGRARAQALAAPAAGQGARGQIPTPKAAESLPFAPPAGMLRPPPGVAREGRRLKRSTRWVPIVLVVIFAIGWFWVRTLG